MVIFLCSKLEESPCGLGSVPEEKEQWFPLNLSLLRPGPLSRGSVELDTLQRPLTPLHWWTGQCVGWWPKLSSWQELQGPGLWRLTLQMTLKYRLSQQVVAIGKEQVAIRYKHGQTHRHYPRLHVTLPCCPVYSLVSIQNKEIALHKPKAQLCCLRGEKSIHFLVLWIAMSYKTCWTHKI